MSGMSDLALREKGFRVLQEQLDLVEAARFLAIVSRESRFDYTKWREEALKNDPNGFEALGEKMMAEHREMYGEQP